MQCQDHSLAAVHAQAPVWKQDAQNPFCNLCEVKFTLFNRRHHCRLCGSVVCGNCSSHKIKLENMGSQLQRICDSCFARMGG